MTDEPLRGREILFEITRMAAAVRVSALDVKSLTEIHLQMPASATELMCQQAAKQRLIFVLRKKGLIT